MTYKRRTDGNHSPITAALRQAGYIVDDYSGVYKAGHPDIAYTRAGVRLYADIKMPGESLRPEQVAWFTERGLEPLAVHDVDEAIDAHNRALEKVA